MIDIETNWQRYKDLLLSTNRPGMTNFIDYLETKTDFKTAPASTKFHLAQKGGLVEHSLNVMRYLNQEYESLVMENGADFPLVIDHNTLIIVALLHDLCKVNYYAEGEEWDKEWKDKHNEWRKKKVWVTTDQLPLGHGEKSVIMAVRYLELTDEEMMAIRWHMLGFDASIHFNYPNGFAFRESMDKCPLLKLLVLADMRAELYESLNPEYKETL